MAKTNEGYNPTFIGLGTGRSKSFPTSFLATAISGAMQQPERIWHGDGSPNLEAFSNPPPAINSVITVVAPEGDELISSPFALLLNGISYTSRVHGPLLDRVLQVIIRPAKRTLSHSYNSPARTVEMERIYKTTSRSTDILIEERIVATLECIMKELTNPSENLVSATPFADTRATDARREHAKKEMDFLETNLAPLLAAGHISLVLGVTQSLQADVEANSLPLALIQCASAFNTPLSDVNRTANPKRSGQTAMCAFYNAVVRRVVRNTFGYTKRGSLFWHELFENGDRTMRSLVHSKGESCNMYLTTATGQRMKIKGVLLVNQELAMHFKNCPKGTREGYLPMYLHNQSVYLEDNTGKTFIKLNDPNKVPPVCSCGKSAIANLLDDKSYVPETDRHIGHLSAFGQKLLGWNAEKPDEMQHFGSKAKMQAWLGNLAVRENTIYMETGSGEVVVVGKLPETDPQDGRPPTGMTVRTEVAAVVMGDFDYDGKPAAINRPKKRDEPDWARIRQANEIQPITMQTPALFSGVPHRFTLDVMAKAFLDPFLHCSDIPERNCQNSLDIAYASTPSCAATLEAGHLRELWGNRERIVGKIPGLVRAALRNDRAANNALDQIEISPFYALGFENDDHGRKKVKLRRRETFGEMPPNVHHLGDFERRGCLYDAAHQSQSDDLGTRRQRYLAEPIADFAADNIIRIEDVAAVVAYAENMARSAFPDHPINDIFAVDLFHARIVVPFLTSGRVVLKPDQQEEAGADLQNRYEELSQDNNKAYSTSVLVCAEIAKRMDRLNDHARLGALLATTLRTTPLAIYASITSGHPVGLAATFLRGVRLYSPECLYAKPNCMDMIVSADPAKVTSVEGGQNLKLSCTTQTVSNMIGGAAIKISGCTPCPRADDLATVVGDVPRVSLDHLIAAGLATTDKTVFEKSVMLTTAAGTTPPGHQPSMELLQNNVTAWRTGLDAGSLASSQSSPGDDAYVAVLRPAGKASHEPFPFLGKPRFLACGEGGPFHSFYLNQDFSTSNVYMSNFGGLYNQRYLLMLKASGYGSTSNIHGYHSYPCCTLVSRILQEAFDFGTGFDKGGSGIGGDSSPLSAFQRGALDNLQAYIMGETNNLRYPSVPPHPGDPGLLASDNLVARMGFAVPLTVFSSDESKERILKQGVAKTYFAAEKAGDYAIFSHYDCLTAHRSV